MAGIESVLGFRGSGKSTLARSLCASDERLIVCDPKAEYTRELQWVPEVNPDQLRDVVLNYPTFRVGFVPNDYGDVEWMERLFASQRNITLLFDEIDLFYQGSTSNMGEGLSKSAKLGRSWGQRIVAIARMASRMPIEIRDEGVLWCFPIRHNGTRKQIIGSTAEGFDPGTLQVLLKDTDPVTGQPRILVTEVARVDDFEARIYVQDNRTGEIYERQETPLEEAPKEDADTLPDDESDSYEDVDSGVETA